MSRCSKIRHIVKLRQMLQRWRKKATTRRCVPKDVPSGHIAVAVGASRKRFIVRATYLNHPMFKQLLARAEEEYGFTNSGPLAIPCDEYLFEEVLHHLARFDSTNNNSSLFLHFEDFQRYCHMDVRSNLDFWDDSRPILHSVSDKSVW